MWYCNGHLLNILHEKLIKFLGTQIKLVAFIEIHFLYREKSKNKESVELAGKNKSDKDKSIITVVM